MKYIPKPKRNSLLSTYLEYSTHSLSTNMSNQGWTVPPEKHLRCHSWESLPRMIYSLRYVFRWKSLEDPEWFHNWPRPTSKKHKRNKLFHFLVQWYFWFTWQISSSLIIYFDIYHLKVSVSSQSSSWSFPWNDLRMTGSLAFSFCMWLFTVVWDALLWEKEGQAQGGFILKFTSSWKKAGSFLLPNECILREDQKTGDWVYLGVVQSWVGAGLEKGVRGDLTWRKFSGCQPRKNEECNWGNPDLLILWPWTWTFLISTLCLWYRCVLLEGYRQTAVYIKGEYEALKKLWNRLWKDFKPHRWRNN